MVRYALAAVFDGEATTPLAPRQAGEVDASKYGSRVDGDMRRFVLLGHEVPADGAFSLDDLPGSGGRLDLLCRALGSALFLSHGIREDVRVDLVLQDEYAVHVDGSSVRNARPDERNLAGLIRGALERREDAVGHVAVEASPGVSVSRLGLADVLADHDGAVVHLHEDGTPLVDLEPPENPAFVLSDHRDFTAAETDLLADHADHRVRLGPRAVHADHAVTIAHNYLDTDAYATY